MKELKISNDSRLAQVDSEDYERLVKYNWTAGGDKNKSVIQRRIQQDGKQVHISLASEVMNKQGFMFDHKDRNPFNNQKVNLRRTTYSLNNVNIVRPAGKSGYRGVSWTRLNKKWLAKISLNGNQICIGHFEDKIEAAKAYDKKALELHGEFAILNFPTEAKLA